VPVVYTRDYTRAWLYWDQHPGMNYGIFRWFRGTLHPFGRRIKTKDGKVLHVAIPPWNVEITA